MILAVLNSGKPGDIWAWPNESGRRAVEWPLAILALLVIPALVLEERATDPTLRAMAIAINWIVWLAFLAEFVVELALASRRATFLRASWFNLAIIAVAPPFIESGILQGIRSIRVLRLLRLRRAGGVLAIGLRSARRTFGRKKFHYVATFAVSVVVLRVRSLVCDATLTQLRSLCRR